MLPRCPHSCRRPSHSVRLQVVPESEGPPPPEPAELLPRAVRLLRDDETVVQALKRLGASSRRKLGTGGRQRRRREEDAAGAAGADAAGAAGADADGEDATSRARARAEFEALTEAADLLLGAGFVRIPPPPFGCYLLLAPALALCRIALVALTARF